MCKGLTMQVSLAHRNGEWVYAIEGLGMKTAPQLRAMAADIQHSSGDLASLYTAYANRLDETVAKIEKAVENRHEAIY